MSCNVKKYEGFFKLWFSVELFVLKDSWAVCVVTGLLWRSQSYLAFNHRTSAGQSMLASTSKVTQPLSRSVKDKPHQAICTGDAFSVALSAKEAQKQF